MKHLLIMRHAKSSWDQPGLADHERPINHRGQKDAPRMGELLKNQGLVPDLILCSTALRTRQTVELLGPACSFAGEILYLPELYEALANDCLEALHSHAGDHARVMILAHNPGLEELVGFLTGGHESMSTAAVAHVELDIPSWKALIGRGQGRLVHLWRPKE